MHNHRVMMLTGCASGIGRHLAQRLYDAGATVVATDIDIEALDAVAASRSWDAARMSTRKLDVRRPIDWERAVEDVLRRHGRLDVLLNVAGYLKPGYVHETQPGDVDLHIDVNCKGLIFGTQAVARRMVHQASGHIINIGSLASLAPVPGLCLYSASKFAVRGFSLAVAQELRPHNVHVTVVLPDAVDTPMLTLQQDYDEAAMTFSGERPLSVDEVSALIVERVLVERPLEVTLPATRGALARFVNTFPEVSLVAGPYFTQRGLDNQRKARGER